MKAEMKTMSYERFGRDVNTINSVASLETVEEIIRKSLNISFEWSILMKAQHVIDELQIMQEIFTQQVTVMRDYLKALETIRAVRLSELNTIDPSDAGHDIYNERINDLDTSLERASALISNMEMRREELTNLEKLQAKTRAQVSLQVHVDRVDCSLTAFKLRELLDIKQQQSGIIEAKAAIKRADEAVLQGRSIIVFTVVTIFFVSSQTKQEGSRLKIPLLAPTFVLRECLRHECSRVEWQLKSFTPNARAEIYV
jgi:hypothetical protein